METIKPEQVGLSSKRLERIRPRMQRYVDEGKFAGISTLIARQGQVAYHDCVGLMNLETGAAMQEDTIFRIYSMTKPITSTAILMLYEEGNFRLNDPVSRFIPAFDDLRVYVSGSGDSMQTVALERPVTIRHLLTHTAGLTYSFHETSPVDTLNANLKILSPQDTTAQFIDKLVTLPLVNQPGTVWRYSVATDVLGRLVEVISGQTLGQFFQERIFAPLGMVDTDFYAPPEKHDRLAELYHWQPEAGRLVVGGDMRGKIYTEAMPFQSGGGGLVSTMADYLQFCRMLRNSGALNGERLLGRKTAELMRSNHMPGNRPYEATSGGYGFGLGVNVLVDMAEYGELGSLGSFGWGGAANTTFWIDPAEDLIAILMTQFMPSSHFPLNLDFRTLVYQAIEN